MTSRPWYWHPVPSTLMTPMSWLWKAGQQWRHGRRRTEVHELPLLVVGNPRVGAVARHRSVSTWWKGLVIWDSSHAGLVAVLVAMVEFARLRLKQARLKSEMRRSWLAIGSVLIVIQGFRAVR